MPLAPDDEDDNDGEVSPVTAVVLVSDLRWNHLGIFRRGQRTFTSLLGDDEKFAILNAN